MQSSNAQAKLVDRFGRQIEYVRLSVTDRCDFRCTYCMAETMTFLPRREVLSLEELLQVARAFKALGVSRLRITGGEPLIRRDVLTLFHAIGELGFEDLSLTTNGARLHQFAPALVEAGVDRVNISLDSLQPERFKTLTRTGDLAQVLQGIDTAIAAGFKKIKINTVLLKHHNADEATDLVQFCVARGLDISFIEEMPLGSITSHERAEEFVTSDSTRQVLADAFHLSPSTETTGGPSRYFRVEGTQTRVGFVSPHSHNFCSQCNRVRVSAEGRLLLCLGNEHSVDLKSILRTQAQAQWQPALQNAIVKALDLKPERHHFNLEEPPQILRFMNATGG